MIRLHFCKRLSDVRSLTFCCLGIAILLSQSTVSQAETNVPGKNQQGENQSITFNKDIAAIIHQKCSMCHRPGQVGPFSLITYQDVKNRVETIDAVIDSGYMPPWKLVNHNVEFANDRRLNDDQKAMIKNWISKGMPEGNQPTPTSPEYTDGWMLGEPDLVVKMNGEFEVPASGPDVYRSFVFPLQLPEDKWVKAIELKPTAKTSVHHALFFVDEGGNARSIDGQDGQAGIGGMGFLSALGPPAESAGSGPSQSSVAQSGQAQTGVGGLLSKFQALNLSQSETVTALANGLGAYVPGSIPVPLPGDLAMRLPKGSDVIMQTHFHPSGKPETERAELALYFADKQPSQLMVSIQVPPMFGVGVGLKIPAGESDYRITESFEVPVDVQLISAGAHAHYVCRSASMTATLPDGTTKMLLQIDDWDLDWQDNYFFADPLTLPAGTVLTTELSYDNSADNPKNPNDPPRDIRWGQQSDDEMGSVALRVVAVNESERGQLKSALRKQLDSSLMHPDGIMTLLMQLDIDRDGSLQPAETPPPLSQWFGLLDGNNDGSLAPNELELVKQMAIGLRSFRTHVKD